MTCAIDGDLKASIRASSVQSYWLWPVVVVVVVCCSAEQSTATSLSSLGSGRSPRPSGVDAVARRSGLLDAVEYNTEDTAEWNYSREQ